MFFYSGTSASAPLAAGMIALALEANRNLTWRDVQHLIVETAKPRYLNALDWKTNGVGRRVSHAFGFGMMDAAQFVLKVRSFFFLEASVHFRSPFSGSKVANSSLSTYLPSN